MKWNIGLIAVLACLPMVLPTELIAAEPPVQFAEQVTEQIGERKVTLHCTGQGTRKLLALPLYEVASYCEFDAAITDSQTLFEAPKPKQLCIRLSRKLSDEMVASTFCKMIDKLQPDETVFEAEKQVLFDYLVHADFKAGDRIVLTYYPKGGLQCRINDNKPIHIENDAFAQVIWEGYIGDPNYHGEELRSAMCQKLAGWAKPNDKK